METNLAVIVACVVLHNIALEESDVNGEDANVFQDDEAVAVEDVHNPINTSFQTSYCYKLFD